METQTQYPPIENNQGYQTPMNNSNSTILYLTNPDAVIEEIVLLLKGQSRDSNGDLQQTGEPLLNELGIQNMVTHIRSTMNQVGIMSNLNEQEVRKLAMNMSDCVIQDLMLNKDKYGISDEKKNVRTTINGVILRSVYLALKRAIEGAGNEKKFWGTMRQEVDYQGGGSGEKKKGFLGSLFNW